MFQGGFCLRLVFSHPRRPCFVRRGVSPPAGGELLCPWRQSNQNATGDGSDEHFVLIVAYPTPSGPSGHLPLTGGVGPGPHYEGYPLDRAKHFRRAKSEWLVPISIGPLGPGFAKIIAGAVSLPRLALPNRRQLVRGLGSLSPICRGGYQPPESLLPGREKVPSVCEADEGRFRNSKIPPAGRPVSGPYERTGCFRIRSRGGCPHPPALEGFSLCRARPPGRAVLNRRRETP